MLSEASCRLQRKFITVDHSASGSSLQDMTNRDLIFTRPARLRTTIGLERRIYASDLHDFSCKAMSIGSRSQSARTYLEKYLDELEGCSRNDLVKHGLMALRETLPTDQVVAICIHFSDPMIKELTEHNVTVCIVGENQKYAEYNNEETKQFLDLLDSTKKPARERAQVNLLELRKWSVSFFI